MPPLCVFIDESKILSQGFVPNKEILSKTYHFDVLQNLDSYLIQHLQLYYTRVCLHAVKFLQNYIELRAKSNAWNIRYYSHIRDLSKGTQRIRTKPYGGKDSFFLFKKLLKMLKKQIIFF